jgi:hypothetical protein
MPVREFSCGTSPRPHPTSHECILRGGGVGAWAGAAKFAFSEFSNSLRRVLAPLINVERREGLDHAVDGLDLFEIGAQAVQR